MPVIPSKSGAAISMWRPSTTLDAKRLLHITSGMPAAMPADSHSQRIVEHQPRHLTWGRAQRHTDADFVHAARHRVGQQAV